MKKPSLLYVIQFIICCVFSTQLFAQELPPIETYLPKDYGAEDQVWSISQGPDDTMYFGNNNGLLTFNGARWELYETPNSSIIRSVKVIDDRIYSGSYMDFGYWEKDASGFLRYTSITKSKNLELLEDEEFWNILELEQWLVFQSLDRIYIYDTVGETFNIISSTTMLTKAFKVEGDIYYQKLNQGIFKLENGQEELVTNDTQIVNSNVIHISKNDDDLLILTRSKGFFTLSNGSVTPWDRNLNVTLSNYIIYNSVQLDNGEFVLGTISNGVLLVNNKNEISFTINQSMGLANNTVLSLFEDKNGNVWLGLDHGISNLNLRSPFKIYKDDFGILGTIYGAVLEDNLLYVGTNQGLFYKDMNTNSSFRTIPGTDGQVWFLGKLNNTIFCGHNDGTFVVNQGQVQKVSDVDGTWNIKSIANNPNLLIQGNYNGLFILERINNQWRLRNKLEGFDISARFLEFVSPNTLLVSHEYKGVYELTLDPEFRTVVNYETLPIHKSVKSSLVKFDSKVLYGSNKGVFTYDLATNKFQRDSILSGLLPADGYLSGKVINVNNRLFAFNENSISYAEKGKLSSSIKISQIPLPNTIRETKNGYENIIHLGEQDYLIGTTVGYIITKLDLDSAITNQSINLNNISVHPLKGASRYLNLSEEPLLKNKENNIRFTYNINDYSKYIPSTYQYRLLGFNDVWSDWSNIPEAYFENLPHGDFVFEVRAKVGNIASNTIRYPFEIEKPFYLKPLAIVIYILLGIVLLVVIHMLNRMYYKKKHKKEIEEKEQEIKVKQLENEKQLVHYKNLDLQRNIELKNRELSLSTMNLIKRNDLLNDIKKELTNNKDNAKVIGLINKSLNDSDDWKLFEKAFNSIDKEFINKLKTAHPKLTANDIRLCTYLRLNLSSKEIAPLFNISFRSVEVKRYRLRKKMNLAHEASLSNYILHL